MKIVKFTLLVLSALVLLASFSFAQSTRPKFEQKSPEEIGGTLIAKERAVHYLNELRKAANDDGTVSSRISKIRRQGEATQTAAQIKTASVVLVNFEREYTRAQGEFFAYFTKDAPAETFLFPYLEFSDGRVLELNSYYFQSGIPKYSGISVAKFSTFGGAWPYGATTLRLYVANSQGLSQCETSLTTLPKGYYFPGSQGILDFYGFERLVGNPDVVGFTVKVAKPYAGQGNIQIVVNGWVVEPQYIHPTPEGYEVKIARGEEGEVQNLFSTLTYGAEIIGFNISGVCGTIRTQGF